MEERLASVKFSNSSKPYFFSTDNDTLVKGDKVVVETIRGLELGELTQDLSSLDKFNLNTELKRIKRKANDADLVAYELNLKKAEEAIVTFNDILTHYDLDMKLVNCEYTLDASKVIFVYTSDGRVDFRDLLKELANVFRCRIELRQIGPRDKAKLVGGIGPCGLPLCCSTFLGDFGGVSINMAKNQLLAINIEKISGTCGRLLCCLKYEDEAYSYIKKKFPKIGTMVKYDNKLVKVTGMNVVADLVKIESDGVISFVELKDIKIPHDHKKEKNNESRSH